MRPSKLNTTLAVLRRSTGTTAHTFATILGIKVRYLRDLESGRHHRLGKELAGRIAEETGCCPKWLLHGAPRKRCVFKGGEPFTQLGFEAYRAMRAAGLGYGVHGINLPGYIPRLAAIAEAAASKSLLPAFQSRYERLIDELDGIFGSSAVGFRKALETSFPRYWVSQGTLTAVKEVRYSLPSPKSETGTLEADGTLIGRFQRESTGPIAKRHPRGRASVRRAKRRAPQKRKKLSAKKRTT